MLGKNLKFVLSKRGSIIALNLGFILLLAKINAILKKQSCKNDVLIAYDTGHIKMILVLSTKVVVFYMQTFIV